MHDNDQTATCSNISLRAPRGIQGEPEVGTILADRFLLQSVLGSGSTGTVYAAVDASVGQNVAVKLLHPNLRDTRIRERLRREVRASRPGHANIVTIFDLHESNGRLFLSMERVEGKSLRDTLKRSSPLAVDQVLTIGIQITSALSHLHARGLVHRDVKPGNILIAGDGTVKLCDMGLARPLEDGVTVTETEMVVGTPNYMAPEQATGAALSGASDIYGLGLTLYQTLTGEIPLKEPTAVATLSRRQRERPAPVCRLRSDCPRWLDRLIRRMLEPNPRDRPSAEDVAKAFETERLLPRPQRRVVIAAATVLLVIAAGISGARLLTRPQTTVVEVGKTSITGLDAKDRITWQREFDIPVLSEQRTDIDGDGQEDVIIILSKMDLSFSRLTKNDGPEIWIFRNDGSVVTHFLPEEKISWNFDYDLEVQATLHLLDLNHNGHLEAVVVVQHENFFPAVIFAYRPSLDLWDQILTHPGHILDIRATPPQSKPGLRFIAVNNRLGVMGFLGEVFIADGVAGTGHNVRSQLQPQGLQSPPDSPMTSSSRCSWGAYVPLPMKSGPFLSADAAVRCLEDGGLELSSTEGEVLIFDKYWNTHPGPHAGMDLRNLRKTFMKEVYYFSSDLQVQAPSTINDRRADMLARFEVLLAEPAYRVILDLKSSRALARADRLDEAQDILRQTVIQTRHIDAIYRLAHFEALANDFTGATDRLTRMMTSPGQKEFGTRALFDGPHLALRIGIENHDSHTIDLAVTGLSARGKSTDRIRLAESLRARARLWWDEVLPEDLSVTSWGYAPSGEAIACLARWRQGVNRPDDIAEMESFIQRNPDAKFEGLLARGAALLGSGKNVEALDDLSVLVQQLEFPSKDDFPKHQLLELAQSLRLAALQADGQNERARSGAELLLPTLTPDLLPFIVTREVLETEGRRITHRDPLRE